MGRTHLLRVLAATLTVGLIAVGAVSTKALVIAPASFQANGSQISDWYWLRAPGNTATWTFDVTSLQAARSGSVYLNMSALATNRANGGSGYSTSIKLSVSNGTKTVRVTVPLRNPFRPIDPDDSGGVGYPVYGYAYLTSSLWKQGGTLTITSLDLPVWRYHVAVKQSSLLIGYSVR